MASLRATKHKVRRTLFCCLCIHRCQNVALLSNRNHPCYWLGDAPDSWSIVSIASGHEFVFRALVGSVANVGWRAMRGGCGGFTRPLWGCRLFAAAICFAVFVGCFTIGFAPSAHALPSFARQTGQPCGACHTDFPALTPYGRRFKLLGYTAGGGEFRTTPFSSNTGAAARAELDKLRGYAKTMDTPATQR